MYKKSSASQYNQIDLETAVANADPHRLVQLLFEGALLRLARSKIFMERGEYEKKNEVLGRVVEIVGTLQEALNAEKGGQVAVQLDQLYDYMLRRLFTANKENDPAIVDEIIRLLAEIKSGWDGIRNEYLESIGAQPNSASPSASTESLKV